MLPAVRVGECFPFSPINKWIGRPPQAGPNQRVSAVWATLSLWVIWLPGIFLGWSVESEAVIFSWLVGWGKLVTNKSPAWGIYRKGVYINLHISYKLLSKIWLTFTALFSLFSLFLYNLYVSLQQITFAYTHCTNDNNVYTSLALVSPIHFLKSVNINRLLICYLFYVYSNLNWHFF